MKVELILGPTASGKTQFALQEAKNRGGVIVNADSLQFYKDLSIGSAAPTAEDFHQVPHYLFHCLPYPQEVSVGWFYREVTALLENLKKQGAPLVLVVGGSGFYLSILEKGLLPLVGQDLGQDQGSSGGRDPELRSLLEQRWSQGDGPLLYAELQSLDPQWALKIKLQDGYRIIRALEIMKTTGKSLSQSHQEWEASRPPFPYPLGKIGLTGSRPWFYKRICERTEKMLAEGLLDEIRPFLKHDQESWAPFKSVGYKEALSYLKGEISSIEILKEEIVKSTMLLVKKQKTWFRKDQAIKWIDQSELHNYETTTK
jgi:tRNA dimethylallyltransferase